MVEKFSSMSNYRYRLSLCYFYRLFLLLSIFVGSTSTSFNKKCINTKDLKIDSGWSEEILPSLFLPADDTPLWNSTDYLKKGHHHWPQLILRFTANRTEFDLKLIRQRDVPKEDLKVFVHNNKLLQNKSSRNCSFYFGTSRKNKRTTAYLEICIGINGVIIVGRETFLIKSLNGSACASGKKSFHPHLIWHVTSSGRDRNPNRRCANGSSNDTSSTTTRWLPYYRLAAHRAEFLRNLKIGKSKKNQKPSDCLHLKLGLILDQKLVQKFNCSHDEIRRTIVLMSIVLNQFLKEIYKNFHLELIFLDLWVERDLFPISPHVRFSLSSLLRHAQSVKGKSGLHYLHLLSSHMFEPPHGGIVVPDSICTRRAVGLSFLENPDDIISAAADISHMVGHVLGLGHDDDLNADEDGVQGCSCPAGVDCSMSSRGHSDVQHFINSPSTSFLTSVSNQSSTSTSDNQHSTSHRNSPTHHQVRLGWTNCSIVRFVRNLQLQLLDCLKATCHHQHRTMTTDGGEGDDGGSDELGESTVVGYDNGEGSVGSRDPGNGSTRKKTFATKCGNGKLERTEECDCGTDEDCQLTEPCCDAQTCLFKPWTNCKRGDCCFNCTLLPNNQICRDRRGPCDVPEFCSGISEECPRDIKVQDGQRCEIEGDAGACHKGMCHSYDHQCKKVWGPGSSKASDECYSTFNKIGAVNGHCGSLSSSSSPSPSTVPSDLVETLSEPHPVTTSLPFLRSSSYSTSPSSPLSLIENSYKKCLLKDVKCGLLQCSKGTGEPIERDDTINEVKREKSNEEKKRSSGFSVTNADVFFVTTIKSHEISYECKVVNNPMNPSAHLVEDGSPCMEDHICSSGTCLPLFENGSLGRCPVGINGLVCSGNGVCTDEVSCFCDYAHAGNDCSLLENRIVISPLGASSAPLSLSHYSYSSTRAQTTVKDGISGGGSSGNNTTIFGDDDDVVGLNETVPEGANEATILIKMKDSINAFWLLSVMVGVVFSATLVLVLCLLCYRRKTPKPTKKQQVCQMRNQSLASLSRLETVSEVNRIISFGNLPSYRADKLKKAMRGHSETESEKSGSKRSSTEVKVKLSGGETGALVTYVPLPNPPDKGILKRPGSESKHRKRQKIANEGAGTEDDGSGSCDCSKSDEKVSGSSDGDEARKGSCSSSGSCDKTQSSGGCCQSTGGIDHCHSHNFSDKQGASNGPYNGGNVDLSKNAVLNTRSMLLSVVATDRDRVRRSTSRSDKRFSRGSHRESYQESNLMMAQAEYLGVENGRSCLETSSNVRDAGQADECGLTSLAVADLQHRESRTAAGESGTMSTILSTSDLPDSSELSLYSFTPTPSISSDCSPKSSLSPLRFAADTHTTFVRTSLPRYSVTGVNAGCCVPTVTYASDKPTYENVVVAIAPASSSFNDKTSSAPLFSDDCNFEKPMVKGCPGSSSLSIASAECPKPRAVDGILLLPAVSSCYQNNGYYSDSLRSSVTDDRSQVATKVIAASEQRSTHHHQLQRFHHGDSNEVKNGERFSSQSLSPSPVMSPSVASQSKKLLQKSIDQSHGLPVSHSRHQQTRYHGSKTKDCVECGENDEDVFKPDPKGAYTKAPGSPSSPEDVGVEEALLR